jgi:effector-binding domain-containing protein
MTTAIALEFAEVNAPPALAVQAPGQSGPDPGSIGAAMQNAFGTLMSFVTRHRLAMNGHPRAIYTAYGPEGISFIAALPVAAGPAEGVAEPRIHVDVLPAARAYRFTHRGPYADLAQTYNRITEFMKEKGWMRTEADWVRFMPMWEEYLNDPETTSPADLLTYIYLPAV